MADHVIKRDLIDSEEGQAAQSAMKRLARALERERDKKAAATPPAAGEKNPIEALPVDPTTRS